MADTFFAGQKDYIAKLNEMGVVQATITNSYYGPFAADPTLRPDGTAIQTSDRYFNTVASAEKIFNGTLWYTPSLSAATLATSGGAATVGTTPAGNLAATTVQAALNELDSEKQATSARDSTGGYAGLTLFKLNMRNALNTFTSWLTNANTAARTYTLQDRDGTLADNNDLALKVNLTTLATTAGAGTVGNTPAGNIAATTVQAALNELDAEKYGKNTILGAATQSAGVPTGAIIERGSNANGSYVAFADGTLICTRSEVVNTAVSSASGAIYYSLNSATPRTTPITFISPPVATMTIHGSDALSIAAGGITAPTTTTFGTYYHVSEVSLAAQNFTYTWLAVGRWF